MINCFVYFPFDMEMVDHGFDGSISIRLKIIAQNWLCDSIKIAFILVPTKGSLRDRFFNLNIWKHGRGWNSFWAFNRVQWAGAENYKIEIHLHHIHFTSLGSIRMCRLNIFKYSSHTLFNCVSFRAITWFMWIPLDTCISPLSRSLCVWAASMRIKHFLFCLFDLSEFVFTFLFSFSFLLVNFVSEKKHQFQIIEKKIKNNQI